MTQRSLPKNLGTGTEITIFGVWLKAASRNIFSLTNHKSKTLPTSWIIILNLLAAKPFGHFCSRTRNVLYKPIFSKWAKLGFLQYFDRPWQKVNYPTMQCFGILTTTQSKRFIKIFTWYFWEFKSKRAVREFQPSFYVHVIIVHRKRIQGTACTKFSTHTPTS